MDGLLRIVADDYGYARSYDAGILEAARAEAIDAVSVMALRDAEASALLDATHTSGLGIGLHLEPARVAPFATQLEAFQKLFGRPPGHIDGHHHCHAESSAVLEVVELARRLGCEVRSVDAEHRRLLRAAGIPTTDRLLGRLSEDEPVIPAALTAWMAGEGAPRGTTEWMVHPGYADTSGGSSFDRGREADLAALLELGDREAWRRRGVNRDPRRSR